MKNLLIILCLVIYFTSCEENVVEAVHGCFDSAACNYNPDATYDNNSCEYNDCYGDCGGDAFEDDCEVCVGGNTGLTENFSQDCAGECFGVAVLDDCGICLGDGTYCLPIQVTFGNIDVIDEVVNVEILIDNPQNLNGFQFYLNEASECSNQNHQNEEDCIGNGHDWYETQILSATGGLCEQYGFDVIVNPESQTPNLIIGFSFNGDIIPSGSNGILTNLTLNSSNTDLCFELGNGSFTKSVNPFNELDQLYDNLDGSDDDVIEYSVNFGDCITIPVLN
mgnify:CR=1 FL=1